LGYLLPSSIYHGGVLRLFSIPLLILQCIITHNLLCILLSSWMNLFAIPFLAVALLMVWLDRNMSGTLTMVGILP